MGEVPYEDDMLRSTKGYFLTVGSTRCLRSNLGCKLIPGTDALGRCFWTTDISVCLSRRLSNCEDAYAAIQSHSRLPFAAMRFTSSGIVSYPCERWMDNKCYYHQFVGNNGYISLLLAGGFKQFCYERISATHDILGTKWPPSMIEGILG